MTKQKKASGFHFGNKPEYRHLCQQDKVFAHRMVREFERGGGLGGACYTYGPALREAWIKTGLTRMQRAWVVTCIRNNQVNMR